MYKKHAQINKKNKAINEYHGSDVVEIKKFYCESFIKPEFVWENL